jgi:hypothetical protein
MTDKREKTRAALDLIEELGIADEDIYGLSVDSRGCQLHIRHARYEELGLEPDGHELAGRNIHLTTERGGVTIRALADLTAANLRRYVLGEAAA